MSDPVKKSVQIDLEVDTTTTDSSQNPYQGLIHLAKAVDAWRIFAPHDRPHYTYP